ncbi:HTH gntR-type domain-containing protein [Ruminococcaceae bacterium BL-6]|jgi:DNA-binding GntR family transcriptional regulator|nr:HTH gntR-type domain-containing protein [Ruminococcaceae bacterium BL-6]HBC27743.1 hypothetical protein [Oscillospiraceae bacterium]HCA28767.1 hypothetical protein [Oscillospiraceae bacterium]
MEPIRSVQTKLYIASLLRDQIFSGSIATGEHLQQEFLANKLGVSRTPVREALQMLENEGLLDRLPNRYMRVVGITTEDIDCIFRILSAFETEMAVLILEKQSDFSSLERSLEQFHDALETSGASACAKAEIAFHMQLSSLTENRWMIRLHQSLFNGYVTYALNYPLMRREKNFELLQSVMRRITEGTSALLRASFDAYFSEIATTLIKRN